jgi:hypothetical protein
METKTFLFNNASIRYQDDNGPLRISTSDFFKALDKPLPNNLGLGEDEWISLPKAKQYAANNREMLARLAGQFISVPDLYRDGDKV